MNEVRIYYEGHKGLREGFSQFFAKVLERAPKPKFIASGPRTEAIKNFQRARNSHPEATVLLLVDAEGPPPNPPSPDGHYMVQIMESWFLADRQTLAGYYGNGFHESSLPGSATDIERIEKSDVLNGLEHATRNTRKRRYHKTEHATDPCPG